jgi:hypothetical protein
MPSWVSVFGFILEMHMNEITLARPLTADQLKRMAFWQAYLKWLAQASEKELEEVAAILTADLTGEVRPLAAVLRDAMNREATRRCLPSSLAALL